MAPSTVTPQLEFLQPLPAEYQSDILQLAEERSFDPGTILFREGTIHRTFYLIVSGHIRLDMLVPDRGRIALLTVGPGDVLAWSALLADGMMTSTATALEPVTTLAFDGLRLCALCSDRPEVGYHLMKQLSCSLSRRLVATRLQLLDLFSTSEPVPGNLSSGSPVDEQC